jgi:hypothetical protein
MGTEANVIYPRTILRTVSVVTPYTACETNS